MQGKIKALANEDTWLPTQMFPLLSAGGTFVADTKNVSDFVQKHIVSATNVSQFSQHGNTTFILCPARLRAQETLWATMCPLLPESFVRDSTRWKWSHNAHSFFAEQKCNLILTNTLNVHQLWHLSNYTQKVQQREKLGFLRGDVNL